MPSNFSFFREFFRTILGVVCCTGGSMADESENTLDERLERIQRRAENFRELLHEGDEVTIARQDGEMHVAESYRSQFERKHAKLFGRMLSVEAQMEAGLFPYF